MAVAAVIFDLYGTLVPEFPRSAFYETVAHMADVLGADPSRFRAEWDRTAVDRQTGAQQWKVNVADVTGVPASDGFGNPGGVARVTPAIDAPCHHIAIAPVAVRPTSASAAMASIADMMSAQTVDSGVIRNAQ